ncbi:MAG TPA: hypothetical protein VIU63_11275, partial [Nitrospira sp.]
MTTVSEIAPDMFRICTFVPDFNLQFSQFLVRDHEPLLFHTGPRGMFAAIRDAVAQCSIRPRSDGLASAISK